MHVKPNYGKEFRTKATSRLVLALWGCQLLASGPALAAPQGGVVTSGSAVINQSGSVTNINQSTNKATINWQGFSTAPTETVNFNQPNASSITLNRVIGNEASVLQGALNATGKVFLINSNGVLMTKGSSVNTGGFVASTLNITDADFNAGSYVFKANGGTGSVVNQGAITAKDGGYVALLGNNVSNQGTITATKGTVALSSGDQITLNFNGDALVNVTIDEGTLNGLVENKQAVYADGGTVILTAKAADDLLSAQVNNSGIIQARTIGDLKGTINLHAYGGTTNVNGTLDASAPNTGDGGSIETSGDHVKIADGAVITTKATQGKTGTWLIDPDGFTVGTDGDMTGTALTNALANGNVTIASTKGSGTDGNIDINEAVTWSANTLTLNATNNIFVNNVMSASGTANFAANYGHVLDGSGNPTATVSGTGFNADGTPMGLYTLGTGNSAFSGKINFSGTGGVTLNGAGYTVINDLAGLTTAKNNLAGNYVLGSDISGLSASTWSGAIGDSTPFTGIFNGFGHRVSGTLTATGLFGTIGSGSVVSNLGMYGVTVNADPAYKAAVGTLANYNQGSIINTFASGGFVYNTNIDSAGGLVGNNSGLIAQSYFSGYVRATNIAGGLVGTNNAGGKIIDSWASGTSGNYVSNTAGATGITYVGGFVGVNNGEIDRSYDGMFVKLTDSNSISGVFAGKNTGTIDQSYAYVGSTASGSYYSAGPYLAGFVGDNSGTISNSYTTALNSTYSTQDWIAGFAYKNTGTITNSYADSYSTAGTKQRYGFVYDNTGGTITNAYWFAGGTTPVVIDSSAATKLAAVTNLKTLTNATGFDPSIWGATMQGYPILKNLPVYITTQTTPAVYGSATNVMSTLKLIAVGLQGGGGTADAITNAFTVTTTDNGYIDAGTQSVASLLATSTYTNVKGTVTVTPKALTISGVVADKTYDGTTSATLNTGVANGGLVGLVGTQALNIDYTGAAFTDKNAATGKTVNLTYTAADGANGGKMSNYTIATTTKASIAKKSVSATVTGNDKTYDGTTGATVSYGLSGVIPGDSLSLGYSAAFADKNAGTGKTVTVSELSLTGTDSGNYTISTSPLTTTATITPLILALYGIKADDGSTSVDAGNIHASNIVGGDTVTFGGSAKIAGSTAGTQPISDVSGLTVSNPNYTVVGSVGNVVVGGASLVLDHVASGTASIATSGATTTITTSDKAVIDWLRFSLAANETLNFVQPSATSIVLNRVTTTESSVIAGMLNANGRVFIVNTNGILFAAGSSVNTAGLVASALELTDANFINNNYVFTAGNSTGSVIAKGDIVIVDGGFLALAGNGVTTSGTVTVPGGDALLASADQLTLTLNTAGNGLSGYAIAGLNGATTVGGTLNVASASGNGGLVEMAGDTVSTTSDFALNTGTNGTWSWTQDGAITIGNGGAFTGNFVETNLGLRNLALNTMGGDITVNDALAWSTDTKLTLGAAKDITINKSITATGANAGLAMNYGGDYGLLTKASYSGTVLDKNGSPVADKAPAGTEYASITLSGSNATLAMNGKAYTLIHSMADLAAIDDATGTASSLYALAQNVDAVGSTYTSSPIAVLSGILAGLGHTVNNLTINAPSSEQYVGLIGKAATGSTIRDIGVVNATITSQRDNSGALASVGALVASLDSGIVSHAYSTGSVSTSYGYAAGLIGWATGAAVISDSYSDAQASGSAAGLIGRTEAGTSVLRSHATGDISGISGGGLIAQAYGTRIANCYATGDVTLSVGASGGGLVGSVTTLDGYDSSIVNSFAKGNVTGGGYLGGLVGNIMGGANMTIDNSYATGNVTASNPSFIQTGDGVGGLVGGVTLGGTATLTISKSHANGNVTAELGSNVINVGGLVGSVSNDHGGATIADSYATGDVTAPGAIYVGGLGGFLVNVDITGSHATGRVVGSASRVVNGYTTATGGLAGLMDKGGIDHSYSSGLATGYTVGGLVGDAFDLPIDNSYYNSDGASPAVGRGEQYTTITDSQGLATGKFSDIDHYLDHTIGQVLADRDVSFQVGQISVQVTKELVHPSSLSTQVVKQQDPSAMDAQFVYVDSDSYSADIKAIDADGVRFQLEEKSPGGKK